MSVRDDHRREFDESFARPFEAPEPRTGLLAVEIAGTRYAVLLDDIQSVSAAGIITAVPSARPELVGVTSQRGRILAVFDLGALLGHPRGAPPAWLVIARGQPIAFGVAVLDGHIAVPRTAIAEDTVNIAGVVRPIAPLRRLVTELVDKKET